MSDYNDGLIPEPCLRLNYGFGQQYASVELGDGTGYVRMTDELRGEHHKMKRWYDDELRAALDENSKLRKLAEGLIGHVKHPPCEGCIAEMNCDCSDLTQCDEWLFFEADARRLGIEVPQ